MWRVRVSCGLVVPAIGHLDKRSDRIFDTNSGLVAIVETRMASGPKPDRFRVLTEHGAPPLIQLELDPPFEEKQLSGAAYLTAAPAGRRLA